MVASIFVNRLQFAPHEDFDTLPAHLRARLRASCARPAATCCSRPTSASSTRAADLKVQPPAALADILEGHFRPGFFTGVCTVVLKLFNCVQPRVAVFGKKDYQQLMVIRHMVRQFALPIEIVGGETGARRRRPGAVLAQRLPRRRRARRGGAAVARAAGHGRCRAARAQRDLPALEARAMQSLARARLAARLPGGAPPRRPARADRAASALVVLAAARLGTTRLIDNLELTAAAV